MDLVVKDYDISKLNEISALARRDNDNNAMINLPVLKINYDETSKHGKGSWVVGQKKDENKNIIDEGEKVESFIILKVRNRYSLFNLNDKSKNCRSPLFKDFEKTKGYKYGYVCGKDCPHRSQDSKPKCSAQIVVFGIAITVEGEKIDCVTYVKGDSYMLFKDYLKTLTSVVIGGKTVEVPMYAIVNKLSTVSTKNKVTSMLYYIVKMEKQTLLSPEDIKKLSEKVEKVEQIINALNNISDMSEDEEESTEVVDMSNTKEAVPVKSESEAIKNLFD